MRRLLGVIIFLLGTLGSQAQTTHLLDSTTLTSRVVKSDLDIPWEIIWGPDDHIWCTERFGRVSRINPITGTQDILLDISSDVYERSEAGMLGMALHPDFVNNPHVFIAYTYLAGSEILERLVRYNYSRGSLTPADTLIEGIIGNATHIGCRLIFLPDNTLLMTTGDAQKQSLPQDRNSLAGKVLRMNTDGSIPTNNPDPTSHVWSYGHRNAQGLWLAPNGIVYSSEHGPSTDDELNIISGNWNYGWPDVRGFCDTPPELAFCNSNFTKEPLAAYTPTIAPSDIIWYDHPAIPEFQDKLLMTVLKDRSLIAYTFNATGDSVVAENKYFRNDFGRLRDVCVSPAGKVYLATNGSSWANTSPFTHSIIELSNNAYMPSSVDDLGDSGLSVKVFPNPLSQNQTLTISIDQAQHCNFELYNMAGQLVLKKAISETEHIDLQAEAGLYFYRLVNREGKQISGKLVVE
ncbi:MAG: PQQ-dependent sugar dehydrogenase [Bacteroidia bacterium]